MDTFAAVLGDLAPTGKLRVAFQSHPAFIAAQDSSTGELEGVGVELARSLAAALGVALSGVLIDRPDRIVGAASTWDVAFVPVNPVTTPALDVTAPYILIGHAYLVPDGSAIRRVADADRPEVRIASNAGSPHTAMLQTVVKSAQVVLVSDSLNGLQMLHTGEVEAYASGRFELIDLQRRQPGYRISDDDFFVAKLAAAMATNRSAGFAYLKALIENAKADGSVRRAIHLRGPRHLQVAPSAV